MKTSFLKGSIVAVLLFPSAQAIETFQVQSVELNLNSETHDGQLYADFLKFGLSPLRIEAEKPQVNFSWNEGNFKTQIDDIQFSYSFGKESFLSGLQGISTSNLTVDYLENKRLRVENNGLLIEHSGTRQLVPELSLTCAAQATESLIGDVSSQCLHLGRLKVPSLNFDDLSGKQVSKSLGGEMAIDKIEEIDLMILQKSFNLSFRVKLLFRWKVKASGSIDYTQNEAGNSVISIHLDKAKVGFLSLKGRLLKEISEANLESVKVQGDRILITI